MTLQISYNSRYQSFCNKIKKIENNGRKMIKSSKNQDIVICALDSIEDNGRFASSKINISLTIVRDRIVVRDKIYFL